MFLFVTSLHEVREVGSAKEMLKEIWGLEQKESLTVVLLLWHWWLERNRIREGERRDLAGLIYIIRAQAVEFLNLATKLNSSPNGNRKKWSRPAGDVLRINSDGAFNPATRKGGWDFVIRDSQGTVIHAGAGAIPNALNALHVEVLKTSPSAEFHTAISKDATSSQENDSTVS
ncbi:hypothetical protein PVAP13_5NG187700 [Panicum virgatum]|uniref:RNase H type-1 domain-containing protein n=1 Tax=Panicum virgatum TaxID=38727 RepID=A0A8T0RTX2_PANVG|nr:hypothetical protein PVAP13_5NG187700 [Panicum virgatum]